MAAPKAPMLDLSGKKAKDVTLAEVVFAAPIKSHLVHEAVRAEAAAARSGTRAAKSRGDGLRRPHASRGARRAPAAPARARPARPSGRAEASPSPSSPASFDLKVNRKVHRAAFRAALSDHAQRGTLAVIDGGAFEEPSTRGAAALLAAWGADLPLLIVAQPEEEALVKSFRNLTRTLILEPSELEVGAIVWARSVLATEGALERVTEVNSK